MKGIVRVAFVCGGVILFAFLSYYIWARWAAKEMAEAMLEVIKLIFSKLRI